MGRPALTRKLDVYLNGRLAGTYGYRPSAGAQFRYDQGWLDWPYRFPISRALPLSDETQTGDSVDAVFENLLPDGPALRQAIAERTDARSARPHDLLAVIGQDCVGAMQFLPHGAQPGDPFRIEGTPQTDAQIAATLRALGTMPLGMAPGEAFRISLAGAQEKTAYLNQGARWLRPVGLTPTTHIFKRPMGLIGGGLDLRDSVENEFFCLLLAREMGLDAAEADIRQFEDQTTLVVSRFDRRVRPAGGLVRVPQEDFLQAMGLPSALKYQQHGGPSMADCLTLLQQSDTPIDDQASFLKAHIFNWMIAAIDGHAKNFSIFLEGDGFRLAPLYDIISAAPDHLRATVRHKDFQLAMSVGRRGHYRLDQIVPRHFDETAKRAGVPLEARQRAFRELVDHAPAALSRARNRLPEGFPIAISEQIIRYAEDRLRLLKAYVG
ncbi:type II toxin-antitoxin system HipA family toxin [Citreicella sp. C3M06]|uniref:type II toxin-antitoxin system HipA family toxin n=1 Tax=Citreicella sp. C3M06 TaxID=2841564 RepID=UPI001C0963E2|nr:type II toxin-antitoxin system HipA family toxin [Citreicella sp. C3M06]MBU2960231.1 type II toxin-antitoxin system HipA family toxin [Citreicella sp. C3M06]